MPVERQRTQSVFVWRGRFGNPGEPTRSDTLAGLRTLFVQTHRLHLVHAVLAPFGLLMLRRVRFEIAVLVAEWLQALGRAVWAV